MMMTMMIINYNTQISIPSSIRWLLFQSHITTIYRLQRTPSKLSPVNVREITHKACAPLTLPKLFDTRDTSKGG